MRRLLVVLCVLARRVTSGQMAAQITAGAGAIGVRTTPGRNAAATIPTAVSACRLIDRAARTRRPSLPARNTHAATRTVRRACLRWRSKISTRRSWPTRTLSDAYGDRGITLTILDRFADAIPDFTRVIEAYPTARLRATTTADLLRADRPRRSRHRGHLAVIEIEPEPNFDSSAAARFISARISSTRRSPITSRRWSSTRNTPSALYDRGIIRLRKGDLAAVTPISPLATHHRPNIAAEMARAGVK